MIILIAFQALLLLPPYQHLNINESIAATDLRPLAATEMTEKPLPRNSTAAIKLRLVHRDKLPAFSRHNDHRRRFEARMKRDATRAASLIQSLSGDGPAYGEPKFWTEVGSGTAQGSAEYLVRIGVGSPATSQYMVIDSGSDIVWVQCQPCDKCYHQTDPVFDPKSSTSFIGLPCRSPVCDRVENSGCNAGQCTYKVSYGDGSTTEGTLALETLTIGGTSIRGVAIGCGHANRGMFIGAGGLLGLGGGSMSFVGQLGGQIGGAFIYCLVSRGAVRPPGWLAFGRSLFPDGAVWAPLLHSLRAPSLYYIGLSGLGVGGKRVPIPEDIFQLTGSGDGGVVMDTGTAVTRLPDAAYAALRNSFVAETANLPRASGVPIFDTCYDLSETEMVRVPTVSFFFSDDGPILTLPATNFLIPVDTKGTFCFAFAPSPTNLTIIGNIQQEGIQISVDASNGNIGFGPNVC